MQCNPEIFQILRYQRPELDKKFTGYIDLQGITMPEPKSDRNLSSVITDDTSIQLHITKMATKCKQLAGWTLRTSKAIGKEIVMLHWKTFILNRLDYWSQLCYPTV